MEQSFSRQHLLLKRYKKDTERILERLSRSMLAHGYTVRLSLRQMQQVFGKGAAKVVFLGTPTERTVVWRGTGRATEAAFSLLGAAQCYPFFPFSTLISLSVYLFFASSSFCLARPPFLHPSLPLDLLSSHAVPPSPSFCSLFLPPLFIIELGLTVPPGNGCPTYTYTYTYARALRTCACARPLLMRAIGGKEGQQVDACMRGLSNTACMRARVPSRVARFPSQINARGLFILIIITYVGPLICLSLIRRRI